MQSELLAFDFCPTLVELLESRRSVGRTGRVYGELSAISTINNLIAINRLMGENRPLRTLEIGLSFGGSALLICALHRQFGRPPEAQHVALDPFQTTVWDSCGLLAVERAGLTGYLDFRPIYSAIELPKLLDAGVQFDLIYVDGSHLFEDVFVDAYFATRLLAERGIIAFDDSSDPHVKKVLQFLRRNVTVGVQELDLGPYRERDSIRYRLARYLGKVQLTAFRRVGNIEREWNAPFHAF